MKPAGLSLAPPGAVIEPSLANPIISLKSFCATLNPEAIAESAHMDRFTSHNGL